MFLENISATCLQDIMCHENLSNADEEDQVLELVINWLKHYWENRKGHSHQLLQKVRLGLVAPEDIKKLIGPEILDIPGCSELVNRALDLHASKKPKEILAIENPDLAAARSTIMAPIILDHGMIKYYDMAHKEWTTMNTMDPLPSNTISNIYELIVVKGVLYAAAGHNGREFLKYQAGENKWIPLPSKPLGIKRIKLVALGAYIYAFGACCAPKDHVIERYDISAEKWGVLKKVRGPRIVTLLAEVLDTTGNTGKCSHFGAAEDNRRREIFIVVFEGKIFVNSLNQEVDFDSTQRGEWGEPQFFHLLEGELVIVDPVMNTYQIKCFGGGDIEEEYGQWDSSCFKPTLFVHKDQLHSMMTELKESDSPVTVDKLRVTQEDGRITVRSDGLELETAELLRDLPDHDAPFYIQDNILVKQSGSSNAGHSKVRSFPQYGENKQLMYVDESDFVYPVWFSFEKKLTVQNKK